MKSCAALFLFHEKVTKWKINRIIVELKEYAGSRGVRTDIRRCRVERVHLHF